MDISHNFTINAPSETVYKAVSTNNGISGWWARDSKVGENEGSNSLLTFNKQGTIVPMDFLTEKLIPNKKVVWACDKNANPMWVGTKITTEIEEKDGVSQVTFTHGNFDPQFEGHEGLEMIKMTWDHFMTSLKSYCEGGEGQPW